MRSGKVPGPSLPRSLLEEFYGEDVPSSNSRASRRAAGANSKLSRKQARRAEREQKKQRKASFYSQGHVHAHVPTQQHNAAGKRRAEERHIDEPLQRRPKTSHAEPVATAYGTKADKGTKEEKLKTNKRVTFVESEPAEAKFPSKGQPVVEPRQKEKSKEKKTTLQKLVERSSSSSALRRPSAKERSQAEKEEDVYITYLERKLGWTIGGIKSGRYGSGLDEDGLDDLLEDIDKIEASVFGMGGSDEIGDEEEDEDSVEGSGEDEDGDEEDEDVEEHFEGLSNDGEADEGGLGVDGVEDEVEVEEWTGFGTEPVVPEDEEKDKSVGEQEVTVENPAAVHTAIRYVPPHVSNRAQSQESEEQIKLTRQLKGLLNRMSEQNISTILDSIEEIYRKHRRHDVTSTLTSLVIDGISSHSMLLDSYVVLHAAFISALHKIVGIEFAAYFVQNVVSSYEKYFAQLWELELTSTTNEAKLLEPTQRQDEKETQGKECSNLIVLLSELYNFQVIAGVLVYDIIRGLVEGQLSEVKVELLLKITRNSGQQLRTDDPSALKDIIQIVHSKLPAEPNAISSRTRFMVETLTNLKNNKVRKDANVVAGDASERMKNLLSGLGKKRQVRSREPLRVTLADLHSAESKGKWWLVGAAWAGDPLAEHQNEVQHSETAKKTESAEHALLKLARKQGMNTDIRRSIFIVLMSSEDYVDACERLSQLKLTEVQQREVIRVILHCCGNEKVYNPYYTFVGQQLCRTSHSHKITLQFCLWDFLRDLGETNAGGTEVLKNLKDDSSPSFDVGKISNTRIQNVARAYAWWIAKDSCTSAILKPVDFTILKPQTRQFFTEFFTHLLANTQLSTPLLTSNPHDYPSTRSRGPIEDVFMKATRIQALSIGLVYFLSKSFRKDAEQVGESGFLLWAVEVATDALRTGADIVAGL